MEFPLSDSKIWLYKEPIDFRAGLYGLCNLVVSQLKKPVKEGLFIFHNRKRDAIKCLFWHKNGYVLIYKKLEKDHFCFQKNPMEGTILLEKHELEWLFAGLDWHKMRHWKELDYNKFA